MSNPAFLRFIGQFRNGDDRRNTGRVAVEGVRCDAGRIIDISAGGARLRRRRPWPVDETRIVVIRAGQDAIVLNARCVRCIKRGMLHYDIGLEFPNVTDIDREKICRVSMIFARASEYMRDKAA